MQYMHLTQCMQRNLRMQCNTEKMLTQATQCMKGACRKFNATHATDASTKKGQCT